MHLRRFEKAEVLEPQETDVYGVVHECRLGFENRDGVQDPAIHNVLWNRDVVASEKLTSTSV